MKCRIFLILFIFSSLNIFASEEIRSKIALINVSIDQNIINSFQTAAEYFEKHGNHEKADLFRAFTSDRFGSGFIIKRNDDFYLVTNRHVIEFAESIEVSLSDSDSKIINIKNPEILYKSDEIDIAIFRLAEENEELQEYHLEIYDEKLKDGNEVWAAGYPGINHIPVWQLSRGIITNHNVSSELEINTKQTGMIQHSATIDPGSSGGPLLIKTSENDYSVVGINTWKISNRSNTFVAINITELDETLNKFEDLQNKKKRLQGLQEKTGQLLNLLKEDYRAEDSLIISEKLLSEYGYSVYIETRKNFTPSIREQLEKSFYKMPLQTMRETLYYKFFSEYEKLIKDGWIFDSIDMEAPDNSSYQTILFSKDSESVEVNWIYEDGSWKLLSFPELDTVIGSSEYYTDKPVQYYDPNGGRITVSTFISSNGLFLQEIFQNFLAGFQYDLEIASPLVCSAGTEIGLFNKSNFIYTEDNTDYTGKLSGYALSLYGGIGLLFPLESESDMQLIPGISLSVGVMNYIYTDFVADSLTAGSLSGVVQAPIISLEGSLEFKDYSGTKPGYGLTVDLMFNRLEMFNSFSDLYIGNFVNFNIGGFIKF